MPFGRCHVGLANIVEAEQSVTLGRGPFLCSKSAPNFGLGNCSKKWEKRYTWAKRIAQSSEHCHVSYTLLGIARVRRTPVSCLWFLFSFFICFSIFSVLSFWAYGGGKGHKASNMFISGERVYGFCKVGIGGCGLKSSRVIILVRAGKRKVMRKP